MITLSAAARLADTKLRTRKIRTSFTILLASLLFGVLVAGSLVMTGALKSITSFREDGLTSRYIVSVNSAPRDVSASRGILRDPVMIAEAKQRYEQLVEEKTAAAKRLGITYTQVADQPPYSLSTDGKETLAFRDSNGIVNGLFREKRAKEPPFDEAQLEHLARQYQATGVMIGNDFSIRDGSSLTLLKDGKEVFVDQSSDDGPGVQYERPAVEFYSMTTMPSEITEPFMLPGNAGWKAESGSIPIVLPQNTVERLLGMEKLASTASPDESLARLKEVRKRASETTFQACYRNSESEATIQQALQQQREITANEGKGDYKKPPLVYALPDPTKCEAVSVVSDTRTAEAKRYDENQKLFDKQFGKAEPNSYLVTFKIVGVSPSVPDSERQSGAAQSLADIVTNMFEVGGVGQVIPRGLYDQLPANEQRDDLFTYSPVSYMFGFDTDMHFVEFANAKDAKRFIDEQSCIMQNDNKCKPLGRLYQATLMFGNSAALDDAERVMSEWFFYAMLGVMALAAIIVWITVGRTIADGRRETAVFRAIGFKRIDIASVYILYTVMLLALVVLFAAGIGLMAAYVAHQQYSPGLTAEAQYAFGGLDMSKKVSLIGLNWRQLALILVACMTTGIVSMIVPLLRNVRRSPIRDMHGE